MTNDTGKRVTLLLGEIEAGNAQATDELLPLVYAELRRMARSRVAQEKHAHSVQPTSLVHQAYLRLLGDRQPHWQGRGHFFAAAAEAMRRILIEKARQRASLKRGGDLRRTDFSESRAEGPPSADEMLSLDAALDGLDARDATMANVVKLRYFAGLTIDETADALELSPRSVNRLWTAARAWLRKSMDDASAQ
ncbi:MAG: ECF-type sigma factor [Pseudomonadota bacterium]